MTHRIWIPCILSSLFVAGAAQAQAKPETISAPKPNTPEAAISAAFAAGLAGDFPAYLKTVHSEHKATPSQRKSREKYEWKRFSQQLRWYLLKESPVTYQIVMRRPSGEKYLRVFIKDQKNKSRMPVPVRLKLDGDAWKIVTSSL